MRRTALSICIVASICCVAAAGEAPDLDAFAKRLDDASLSYEQAVDISALELPLDYGSLLFEKGIVVPVRVPETDRSFELVFIGRGRMRIEAPDDVEAQQLASFTGNDRIDAPIHRAVLVVGDADLAGRLLGGNAVEVAHDVRAVATHLFHEWTAEAEREGFGSKRALLRAMAGDPSGVDYLGIWFESASLGRGFYAVDPAEGEPVLLGSYQLFDREDLLTRREKKRQQRLKAWKERRARKSPDDEGQEEVGEEECGAGILDIRRQSLEDNRDETYEWLDLWVSAARDGTKAQPVTANVEPEHYQVEIELTGDDLDAAGTTRIRLRAEKDGVRVVSLTLGPSLEICEIQDETGAALSFQRIDWEALVVLSEPTVAGERIELTVRFAGKPIDHWEGRRRQRHTMLWHPHAGSIDRASYDVTLRWPEELTLLAAGRLMEQGSSDGVRWERRESEVPCSGFSFEIGDFDTVQEHIGHIDFTFGFHRQDHELTEEIRAELKQTVMASVLFFESRFGHLPINHLTIVMTDRGFSQGMLSFLTLAEGMIHGVRPALLDNRSQQEYRLELIAHEVSHQWWGNQVGWDSYRDQWLSEALAFFSSASFMEQIADDPEDYRRRHASLWRKRLKETTGDGRAMASLGPVVLGQRLHWNHGQTAYHAVVYEKGAAVFSTLAQRLGREPTFQMLGALARSVNNRVISTPTFFRAFERMSGQDLEGFVRQYVRGTGMPAMFYDYRPRKTDQGWLLEGNVLQLPAAQSRFVVRRTEAGWDVIREIVGDTRAGDWANVVPYRVATTEGPTSPEQTAEGMLSIQGERSTFSLAVESRPEEFEIDPSGQILADVYSEHFEPKRYLLLIGEHLAALGRFDEALQVLDRAQQADTIIREKDIRPHLTEETRELSARIHLSRARILLDRGEPAPAREELRAAEQALDKDSDYYQGERTLLLARLELMRGRHALALEALNDYLSEHAIVLEHYRQDRLLDSSRLTSIKISRGEMLALLAIASHEAGEIDSDLLVRRAGLAGVDMRALNRSRSGR